jgi:hypothetical protein
MAFRFAPLQRRGHVVTATISGRRKDGEKCDVPLVSFVGRIRRNTNVNTDFGHGQTVTMLSRRADNANQ